MPTPDQTRLDTARAHSRILDLWFALRPLTSVVRLMNSGAHPDDETSSMLAALGLRDGVNLSYACSTRGEGGQNDIGIEAGADLGALRTKEMERACDILNMRMYWHGVSADDPIIDFGFSKSGEETLGRWGKDALMARFVQIVRTERPDILIPTFLDIPGQHGHHRAMTAAAHQVMQAAADPEFACDLPPWQISKLYLPAWSGAGQAYDDDEPPPPATLEVPATGRDPVSGWPYARIGQMSRAFHRTQGMGRWVPAGAGQDWPLHLAESHVSGPDLAVTDGLPQNLAGLASLAPAIGPDLQSAQKAIAAAVAGFPDFATIAVQARTAYDHVVAAEHACPPEAAPLIAHRLAAKRVQLGHVLRLALGIEARGRTSDMWLRPGAQTTLEVECEPGCAPDLTVTPDLPDGWQVDGDSLRISEATSPSDGYRAAYDPADPPVPALHLDIGGASVRVPFERPPVILSTRAATLTPHAEVINLATQRRQIAVSLSDLHPSEAKPSLALPTGWQAERTDAGLTLRLPKTTAQGLYHLPLLLDGQAATSETRIDHPHIDPTMQSRPAALSVRVLHADLPPAHVAYIGSGHDRVAHWLGALGTDVTDLSDADLDSDAAFAPFDTVVIGIFALRFRPGLLEAMPRLHAWVRAGGHLVTLYHRPWDNWTPETTPPLRLEIGQPSLRWRVTDEAAPVTQVQDHPLLSSPNKIGPEDWNGWHKERGLYFAKSWDPAYATPLEMNDPEEAPLKGALLSAEVGKGRHSHSSLILHHQMARLVPGAFRLMANLTAPATR